MSLTNIALFGANGQVGRSILKALVDCKKQDFNVLVVTSPSAPEPYGADKENVTWKTMDLFNTSRQEMAQTLKGIDAVVSALNGPVLEAQIPIQDGAADAGVKRFIPSEFGMHTIYRRPNDDKGYLHPLWDAKEKLNERAVRHSAINEGKMTYTMIGCGDFYDQERENVWCPWTQKDVDEYTLHVIGDPDAPADWTNIEDFGLYITACLLEPEKTANAYLNFSSDTKSQREIADLLKKHTNKPVKLEVISLDVLHEVWDDPEKAPEELKNKSAFPVDFWMTVKGLQGSGRMFRPKGQNHNDMFPDVEDTTFDKYLKQRFQK
ncbi:NAD(P)-binding protein [Aureobasidium pullulans]|nr:NAD(P)-binding protein [Aureobasidium pullulans]TIA60513.1 NAD(P)-binding protein [Aureobasidium pullulans]